MVTGVVTGVVTSVTMSFFACREDLSHTSYDERLPAAVLEGSEPFLVVGAMAGG